MIPEVFQTDVEKARAVGLGALNARLRRRHFSIRRGWVAGGSRRYDSEAFLISLDAVSTAWLLHVNKCC